MSNTQVPVTEIVWFPVKPGKQPTEGQENMFGVDAGPGFLGGRFGWQLENTNIFHWVMNWSSYDAHQVMMSTPVYMPFVGKILKWCSAIPTVVHYASRPYPPTGVFTSPVTEVIRLSVKISQDEWPVLYEKFEGGLRNAPGYRAHSGGWAVETEGDFVVAIGWESVEASAEWAKTDAGVMSLGYLAGGGSVNQLFHLQTTGDVASPAHQTRSVL